MKLSCSTLKSGHGLSGSDHPKTAQFSLFYQIFKSEQLPAAVNKKKAHGLGEQVKPSLSHKNIHLDLTGNTTLPQQANRFLGDVMF